MDIEWGLLSKLVHSGEWTKVKEAGIDQGYFPDSRYFVVWKFIEEHYGEYRSMPSPENLKERFSVETLDTKESIEYWIDEIQSKKIEEAINETAVKVSGHIEKGKPRLALEELTLFAKTTNLKYAKIHQRPTSVSNLKDEVWKSYLDAKAGKMGIPTPWPTLTDWTRGWFEKDISTFVARSGVGKTFLMLHLAVEAVKTVPVLFISCEMSQQDISQRYFSILFKKNYGGLRRGRLSTFDETGFKMALDQYSPDIDMQIRDGSQGLQIEDIERAVEASDAKLVIVDSCYRIKAKKSRDRFDNMAQVFEELKLLSQVHGKSILASTQLNREYAKKKGAADMSDIALSDVISWTSTNVFGLRKTESSENVLITPLKIRESENTNSSLEIKWDMTRMDFSEIGLHREIQGEEKKYSNKGRPYADDKDLEDEPY